MREAISACIIAGNEESNIRRCLQSVKWCDEIVVVDSFSTDRTVAFSHEFTDRVFRHRWLGYIAQKNLIKDLAEGPWILFVDADEEVSPQLRDEILREFETESNREFAGYEFPRMVWYLGRWITHGDWYPDAKLRLFRKDQGKCGGEEPHDRTSVTGPVKRLRSNLYHYTYSSIADQIDTLNRFTTISANNSYTMNRKFHSSDVIFRPFLRFVRGYIFKRGFLDGLPGLIVAMSTAYSVMIKYAKLWERSLEANHRTDPPSH